MEILTKEELQNFTGLVRKDAITKWLSNNQQTLTNYNLVYAGGINGRGYPIVERLKNNKIKQKQEWHPQV